MKILPCCTYSSISVICFRFAVWTFLVPGKQNCFYLCREHTKYLLWESWIKECLRDRLQEYRVSHGPSFMQGLSVMWIANAVHENESFLATGTVGVKASEAQSWWTVWLIVLPSKEMSWQSTVFKHDWQMPMLPIFCDLMKNAFHLAHTGNVPCV